MSDYHINLFYSDEDEGWIADIPDLESCSAFGQAPEEALREVTMATGRMACCCQGSRGEQSLNLAIVL